MSFGNIPMRPQFGFVDDDEVQPENSIRTTPDPRGAEFSRQRKLRPPAGYYLADNVPYPQGMENPGPSDPDDVASLSAGVPAGAMSEEQHLRASAQRIGMPVSALRLNGGAGAARPAGNVNRMDANFDSHGKAIGPRIGAPGDYDIAKALTPEAVPMLDQLASTGNKVYGRNETTGQDFEYTPRKSLRPDVAIAAIHEARRKQSEVEASAREDKRFGRQVELAKIPGSQRIEEAKTLAQIEAQARHDEQNSPYAQEQLNDLQQRRLLRGKRDEMAVNREGQQLNPVDERRMLRLQQLAQGGTPAQRQYAQIQLDKMTGTNAPQAVGDDYGGSTLDDENRWRGQMQPSIDALGKSFDTGWYKSSGERERQRVAIEAFKKRAARGHVPPEIIDEIIAEAQQKYQ